MLRSKSVPHPKPRVDRRDRPCQAPASRRRAAKERVRERARPRGRTAAWAPAMTLRANGARKRRGNSPRPNAEGTIKVCPEAGRERRLMSGHLGAPARAAVNRERRAPPAGSRACIQDAGRRFAAIPHIRPGHADLAARGTCPADPRRAPTSPEGSAMTERFVGIDVALREHRIAVLDRDGEAVGQSFTIVASTDGVAILLRTLHARDATAAQTLIGLEASGHLWENLEIVR